MRVTLFHPAFGTLLWAIAADLGLGDAVRWHGYLPDVALAEVYACCDVLALVPFDEPFGMVFPEAALRARYGTAAVRPQFVTALLA